jgi:long-chain acyl-CoA synthetase
MIPIQSVDFNQIRKIMGPLEKRLDILIIMVFWLASRPLYDSPNQSFDPLKSLWYLPRMMEKPWLKHYPAEVLHDLSHFSKMTIPAFFSSCLNPNNSKTALSCMGHEVTYAELDRLSNQLASYLQNEVGLKKGDRLALVLPNIIQFPVVFFAAQKLGVVCVATNPQYTSREMLHQFKDSGAKAIVILNLFLDKLEPIINQTEVKTVISTELGDSFPWAKSKLVSWIMSYQGQNTPPHSISTVKYKHCLKLGKTKHYIAPHIDPKDMALLQYTGGTTGISKGAILTHNNLVSNILQVRSWIDSHLEEGKEVVLTALPMFHIFGLTINSLMFLSRNDKLILIPKPIPIENTVKAFEKENVSIVLGVNTLFNALNNNKRFKQLSPSSIKFALAGGMALQESVARAWFEITKNRLMQGFGLTEASPVTHVVPLKGNWPSGSIGVPMPGTSVRIIDEQEEDVTPGESGELCIYGPQIMAGYWKRPDETQQVLSNGWLKTGDIARMDDDGFFYIVDRKKDMILVSGFNVFPSEIEEIIAKHPKVLEVAVVGVPHKTAGEAVKAFVIPKDPSLTERELKSFCKENLISYKVPRSFEFRTTLPKTNVGKILRRELKQPNPLNA